MRRDPLFLVALFVFALAGCQGTTAATVRGAACTVVRAAQVACDVVDVAEAACEP